MSYIEEQNERWCRAAPAERILIEAEWRAQERADIARLKTLLPGWHVGFADPEDGADLDYAEESEAHGVSVFRLFHPLAKQGV